MRVLLVEDEKALSSAICRVLKAEQIVTDTAYDGETGLDDALSGIYDAVILDVMLPKRDGFSILEELRASGSAVPVLMLTARGELEDRLHGLKSGADYYLTKPFQMEELIACLRVITRRKTDAPVMALRFGDTELVESSASLVNTQTGASIKLGAKEY
ncbi:MAG: response regulator, partial [Clostridia bacterium]|nr:response regulator [Clostridia bacterium]